MGRQEVSAGSVPEVVKSGKGWRRVVKSISLKLLPVVPVGVTCGEACPSAAFLWGLRRYPGCGEGNPHVQHQAGSPEHSVVSGD